MEELVKAIKTPCGLRQNVYKSKTFSRNTQFRHHNTIFKTEWPYTAWNNRKEYIWLRSRIKSSNSWTKPFGSNKVTKETNAFRLKSNNHKYKTIETTIRKKRLTFYWRLKNRNLHRLPKKVSTEVIRTTER